MNVVTRFAPSPTGFVHIWSLRTVLYNYLFTRKNNWKFMLRVEDTDRNRLVEWSIENLINVLGIFWLTPDEWPNKLWDKWPYFQSERLDIYQKYVNELIEKDKAYYCFCSSQKLEESRKEQESLWLPTKYDWHCRYLSKEEVLKNIESGKPFTIRLKVPKDEIVVFDDIIKWKIKVSTKDIDDQILLKSDLFPTYHLANVIDDYLMEITHVIRWDEWTSSTPKHILIYDAFWWKPPIFAHIPLLLWKDGKKLSKRTWDVAVEVYLEKWYLVESILNYISLLWWNPKTTEEFFTLDELIEKFELDNVHKAWAIFDIERLNFFNSHYLKNTEINKLYELLIKYLEKYNKKFLEKILTFDENYNKKILNELKTKIKKFDEFEENTTFFYSEPKEIPQELLVNEKMKINSIDEAKKWLELTLKILENNKDFNSIEEVKNIFIEEIQKTDLKNWQVLWPVRVVLSWEQFSPWALELIYILWNTLSSQRIKKVLKEI